MTQISFKQQSNKSINVIDELCHDSWFSPPTGFSLNRHFGVDTNAIPPIEDKIRQDLALSASTTIIIQSSRGNVCITKSPSDLRSFSISLVSHIENVECTKYKSPTGTNNIADSISQMSGKFPNSRSMKSFDIDTIPTQIAMMPIIKFHILYLGLHETLKYLFPGVSVAIAVIFIKSPFYNLQNRSLRYSNTFNLANIELERAPEELSVPREDKLLDTGSSMENVGRK